MLNALTFWCGTNCVLRGMCYKAWSFKDLESAVAILRYCDQWACVRLLINHNFSKSPLQLPCMRLCSGKFNSTLWLTNNKKDSFLSCFKKITTWPYSMKFNRNLPCRTLYKNTRRPKNNLQQQQQYNDRLPTLPYLRIKQNLLLLL